MSAFNVHEAFVKASQQTYSSEYPFTVVGLILNADVANGGISKTSPIVFYFPVGSYKFEKEATTRALEFSYETGIRTHIHYAGIPREVTIGAGDKSFNFLLGENTGMTEVQKSYDNKVRRAEAKTQILTAEAEKRKDIDSVESLAQTLYLFSVHQQRLKYMEEEIEKIEAAKKMRYEELVSYFERNPDKISGWQEPAKAAREAVGEGYVYDAMEASFESVRFEIEKILETRLFAESDEECEIDHIPALLTAPISKPSSSTTVPHFSNLEAPGSSSDSGPDLPTIDDENFEPHKAWKDVLTGKTTVQDFKNSTSAASSDDGWRTVERGSRRGGRGKRGRGQK